MSNKEFYGKTVQEAIKNGLEELNIGIDEANIEVVDEGSGGFLGLGTKKAVVRISKDDPDEFNSFDLKSPTEKTEPKKTFESKSVEKSLEEPLAKEKPAYKKPIEEERTVEKTSEPERAEKEAEPSDETVTESHTEPVSDFLEKLFIQMNLKATFEIMENNKSITVSIMAEDTGKLIGFRGETIDSIQYLTRLAISKINLPYKSIIVQSENYRQKREQTLIALANRIAKKVHQSQKKYSLEPMKSFERRIIHTALQNDEFVTTFSSGEEPNRHIVIAPKK